MKILKLFTILSLLLFISCKSDDDSNENMNNENLIVGIWKIDKEVSICDSGSSIEVSVGCGTGFYEAIHNFTADGKIIERLYSHNNCELIQTEIGAWEIVNNKLFIDWDVSDIPSDFDYRPVVEIEYFEISENRMRLGGNGEIDFCQFTNGLSYNEYIKLQ